MEDNIPRITDKQIKQETEELLLESVNWARNNLDNKFWSSEDIRSFAITRFLHLIDRIYLHSHKYYRNQEQVNEVRNRKRQIVGGTYEIRERTND